MPALLKSAIFATSMRCKATKEIKIINLITKKNTSSNQTIREQ